MMAISVLGNGLSQSKHYADALSVQEAELAIYRRIGGSANNMLAMQTNLANTYGELGQLEKALSMERDIYSGNSKLRGEEHEHTAIAASNYASSLSYLQRHTEVKALLREAMPVARRVLGESHELTLKMMTNYTDALYRDTGATLDDLREAVTTLEETERIARRVLGGAHPLAAEIEGDLQDARDVLKQRSK
jgi:tetratricopeptide (TPR) repeat protein